MSAIFNLYKYTGSGTATNVDAGVKFLSADSATLNATNAPVAIPGVGYNYSYENWLKLYCSFAPLTQCTNFKFWGPASKPDAEGKLTIMMGTVSGYSTPTMNTSTVATGIQDTQYYSQATGLVVSGTLTTAGQTTQHLVLQLRVASGVAYGDMIPQILHYSYDES